MFTNMALQGIAIAYTPKQSFSRMGFCTDIEYNKQNQNNDSVYCVALYSFQIMEEM